MQRGDKTMNTRYLLVASLAGGLIGGSIFRVQRATT
jgi:hypothetical protein